MPSYLHLIATSLYYYEYFNPFERKGLNDLKSILEIEMAFNINLNQANRPAQPTLNEKGKVDRQQMYMCSACFLLVKIICFCIKTSLFIFFRHLREKRKESRTKTCNKRGVYQLLGVILCVITIRPYQHFPQELTRFWVSTSI